MINDVLRKLRSEDKAQIRQGVEDLSVTLAGMDGPDLEEAVHALIGLFYADPIDHPELLPALERAEEVLAGLGERVIPVILGALAESDLKAHFRLASTLGRMGTAAVDPLLAACADASDDYHRIFALYALGKIRAPDVSKALPLLFRALGDANPEVRDTAARSVGKIFERLPSASLSEAVRSESFERLMKAALDRYAGVRSKAIRSLGKMARLGLLSGEQRERLRTALTRVLGKDEAANWDPAYIVRAEAEKAREGL